MKNSTSAWSDVLDLALSNLIPFLGLIIALRAYVIAREQRQLALTATKSKALLYRWKLNFNQNSGVGELEVQFEARGPIPFYDIRLCTWDKQNVAHQYLGTQLSILSSADEEKQEVVQVETQLDSIAYIGFVWSEPHLGELVTLGRRAVFAEQGSTAGTEYWSFTPIIEALSLGRRSGKWKKIRRNLLLVFARPSGPTVG